MARNLTRNTRLFVSNQAVFGSCNDANTWEIKVLDGYNFSQATTTEDITIDEAGSSPIRGQKTYNVAQEPVDITLSTYLRPYDDAANSLVDAPERILWASMAGSSALTDASGNMVDNAAGNGDAVYQQDVGTGMTIDFEESDSNELAKLTLWFHLENSTYRVDNVNFTTVEIDFAIDAIATAAWSGMGTAIDELSAADHAEIKNNWVSGTDYKPVPATSAGTFLRNKLSTVTLVNNNTGTVLATGTAEASTTSTLVDSSADFTTDTSVGDYVTHGGESRVILSRTTTAITIQGLWTVAPSGGTYNCYAAADHAAQDYTLAITGGSLTIENNMEFLTPEELGVVNQPLAGFAGSRAVTGTVTAYLDTGFYGTAALLNDILEDINSVSTSYSFVLSIGGTTSTAKRVDLALGTAQLAVPTINVEDVIATEITFAGQGSAGAIENQDEVVITYHSD
jgi:hypothetical protein